MREIKPVCFSAILFLNIIYSGLCKPIVKDIEDEQILESRSPIPFNSNKIDTLDRGAKVHNDSLPVKDEIKTRPSNEKIDATKSDLIVKDIGSQAFVSDEFGDQEKVKEIKDALELYKTDAYKGGVHKSDALLDEDRRHIKGHRSNLLEEKDEENEKLCEELCNSCRGTEHVFDIAEPSCFCKVTSVKSVKCLEQKITDDIVMKVIAYVETEPKSDEEKLVAQYLKDREELSLNRHRRESKFKRCCGNVAAINPRPSQRSTTESDEEGGAEKDPYENSGPRENIEQNFGPGPNVGKQRDVDSSSNKFNRKRQSSRQNKKQKQHEEQEEDGDENIEEESTDVEENQDDEVLRARKITAGRELENLWRKALRAEDTSAERTEEETEEIDEKQNKTKQKKQVEIRRAYKYDPPTNWKSLLVQKPEEEEDDVVTVDEQEKTPKTKKKLRYSQQQESTLENKKEDFDTDESPQKKNRAASKKREKQFTTNQESMDGKQKPMKEFKLQGRKQPEDVLENIETKNPKINRYKSLDDLLYEQEIKRQKFLSSIREKYGYFPEPITFDDLKSEKEENDGVIKTMTKKKKYLENNTGILGSKDTTTSENTKKKVPKLNKEGENIDDEKSRNKLKAYSNKDFKSSAQENKKYRINKILKEKGDENGKVPEAPKKHNTEKGQLLGETRAKGNAKPIVSPYIDNEKVNKEYENPGNPTKLFRASTPNKEYLEKDNELGGTGKTKETLNSLIAKIRAKYEKNNRDDVMPREKSKLGNKKDDQIDDKKVLGSPLQKHLSSKSSKSIDIDTEDIEKNSGVRKPFFLGQKITPKYVAAKDNHFETENEKESRTLPMLKNIINHEDSNGESLEKPSKYLKSKYSGVKPNLIRDENEPITKKSLSLRNQSKKDIGKEEEAQTESDQPKTITSVRSQYLQKVPGIENSKLEPVLGKQNTKMKPAKSRSIEIHPPQEVINEKVFPGESLEERKKKLDSSLKELSDKNRKNKGLSELPTNNKLKATLEDQRKLLEDRLKEVLEKNKPHPMMEEDEEKKYPRSKDLEFKPSLIKPYSPMGGIKRERSQSLSAPREPNPESKYSKEDYEEKSKKPSLREQLLEQRKASKLESTQMKSTETNPLENSKLTFTQERHPKFSLKEIIEQKKEERQNLLGKTNIEKEENLKEESSNNKEMSILGATLEDKEQNVQAIIDQNPQKHCEKCMEYMNHMTQSQKEQMLGQKSYNTRSISSLSDPKVDTVETEGEVAQEKFLNCKCYEALSGSQSGPIPSQPNLNIVNEEILGQPFNMGDVSKTFDKIKTGIESSVKGANDKISKGFSDLKTNIKNQYEHASHSDLAENLKDSTDNVSQKISDLHIKDAVTKELSDIGHNVQNTYESITQKGIDGNLKDVSNTFKNVGDTVNSEFHHLTDGVVSQPTPRRYVYPNSQQVIPANQLQMQAKYVDPKLPNQQFYPQTKISGNAEAPIILT